MTRSRKIILVAGARPNFMKVAPLLWELRKYPESSVRASSTPASTMMPRCPMSSSATSNSLDRIDFSA